MLVVDKPWFPVRHEYAPKEQLPEFVEFDRVCVNATRTKPGWLVSAGVDPKWSHVAAMNTEYRDGCFRPTEDGKIVLIVTCTVSGHPEYGDRHPEFDRMRFDSVAEAYGFAYEQGLLTVITYPAWG